MRVFRLPQGAEWTGVVVVGLLMVMLAKEAVDIARYGHLPGLPWGYQGACSAYESARSYLVARATDTAVLALACLPAFFAWTRPLRRWVALGMLATWLGLHLATCAERWSGYCDK